MKRRCVCCRTTFVQKNVQIINYMLKYLPEVSKIIVNGDYTILRFKNGEKSVVKDHDKEGDLEKSILFAYAKKKRIEYNSKRILEC